MFPEFCLAFPKLGYPCKPPSALVLLLCASPMAVCSGVLMLLLVLHSPPSGTSPNFERYLCTFIWQCSSWSGLQTPLCLILCRRLSLNFFWNGTENANWLNWRWNTPICFFVFFSRTDRCIGAAEKFPFQWVCNNIFPSNTKPKAQAIDTQCGVNAEVGKSGFASPFSKIPILAVTTHRTSAMIVSQIASTSLLVSALPQTAVIYNVRWRYKYQ